MKRLASLALALGLLVSQVGIVAAAEPAPASRIDHYIVKESGARPTTSIKTSGERIMLAIGERRCYYAYWIAEARNITNTVLFQYKQQVEWCARNGQIVSTYRTTTPITPRPWLWQYASETLYGADFNSAGSRVTYSARGLFNQMALTIFGSIVVGQSHPLITIKAYANGTASGIVSW